MLNKSKILKAIPAIYGKVVDVTFTEGNYIIEYDTMSENGLSADIRTHNRFLGGLMAADLIKMFPDWNLEDCENGDEMFTMTNTDADGHRMSIVFRVKGYGVNGYKKFEVSSYATHSNTATTHGDTIGIGTTKSLDKIANDLRKRVMGNLLDEKERLIALQVVKTNAYQERDDKVVELTNRYPAIKFGAVGESSIHAYTKIPGDVSLTGDIYKSGDVWRFTSNGLMIKNLDSEAGKALLSAINNCF